MSESIQSTSARETSRIAQDFARNARPGIVALEGDLGAGKTTFTQALLSSLGAQGPFTSPTFGIIKQYDLDAATVGHVQGIERVYHIDAYRISADDMVELGWEEMIGHPHALIVVEWPQKIARIMPQEHIAIDIEIVSHDERRICIKSKEVYGK